MNEQSPDFEQRLERQLNEFADLAVPGRRSRTDVAAKAVRSSPRSGGQTLFRVLAAGAMVVAAAGTFVVAMTLRGQSPAQPGEPTAGAPLADLTADERAFCFDGPGDALPLGGIELVTDVGVEWLAWRLDPVDGDTYAPQDLPDAALACRIASLLYRVTPAEWTWCQDEENREQFLMPAVEALGMGEDEVRGGVADGFSEAPGDDPVEYTFACRFAFGYWRESGVSAIVDARSHPFLALTESEVRWCRDAAHRAVLEWAATMLGIETPRAAPDVHQVTAYVRSCRLASLIGGIPPQPVIDHVRDGAAVFSSRVTGAAERELAAIERTTGLVGVFVTQNGGEIEKFWPELLRRRKVVLTYEANMSDGCCASTVSTDFRGDLDPVFDAMNSGDYDAALRQFVAIVRAEAGEPRDAIRRIPDGI